MKLVNIFIHFISEYSKKRKSNFHAIYLSLQLLSSKSSISSAASVFMGYKCLYSDFDWLAVKDGVAENTL